MATVKVKKKTYSNETNQQFKLKNNLFITVGCRRHEVNILKTLLLMIILKICKNQILNITNFFVFSIIAVA